ncbi:hypothetical protein GOQ27_06970 [Clostridium sp. D2Q-11]|uniref:Uncharacterized protein n=1 Tax=Anaeromonas frigoriresistens TaxID=2683708 RepID=A0A942UTB8_9FIRM|nr:hypothetical protein [Anaeromonas frigoriresistens]MBS4538198.1 hypothetical protein [Anaeromonas frigoriresistens]
MVGRQCNQCCFYKKKIFRFLFKGWNKGKCTRIGIKGKKGVCWMEKCEGEY